MFGQPRVNVTQLPVPTVFGGPTVIMVKKRKLSGLGSTELSLAYNALLALRASFQYEFVDEQVEGVGSADRLEEQLDGLLSLMGDRLGRSKVCISVEQNYFPFHLLPCADIQLFECDQGYLARPPACQAGSSYLPQARSYEARGDDQSSWAGSHLVIRQLSTSFELVGNTSPTNGVYEATYVVKISLNLLPS